MSVQVAPCGELIERDPPMCKLDRLVPEDCRGCLHYTPGLNAQERARCEIWALVRDRRRADPCGTADRRGRRP